MLRHIITSPILIASWIGASLRVGMARATWERGRQLYPQAREAALIEKELNNL